ncbi:hypothetical protein [Rhodanobacter lindaniclasticus]
MTRRRLPTLHCLLAALVLLAPCAVPAAAAPPALIPLPAQLAPGDGQVWSTPPPSSWWPTMTLPPRKPRTT